MRLSNVDIRSSAKTSGVPLWQIADTLDISEATLTRKLRRELDDEEKNVYLSIIHRLAKGEAR